MCCWLWFCGDLFIKTKLVKLLDALALDKGLSSVTGVNVVVISEAVDCYLSGVADRCPDGAVPVVTVTARNEALGGAANTAVNVHTLGASVTFISVIGEDWEGALLRQAVEEQATGNGGVSTLG